MTGVARLLEAGHPSGIVRGDAGCASQLRAAGWRVAEVRGSSKAALLDSIAVALEFPDYFGHNYDALLDGLRELEHPTAVMWSGWERFEREHPRDYAALMGVLQQRAQERHGFAVVQAAAG